MNTKVIVAAILGALFLSGGVFWLSFSGSGTNSVTEPTHPVYYYGDTCPHCKDVQKFLDDNDIASKVPYEKKEVWNDRVNAQEMAAREKTCGIDPKDAGVPFVYFEGKCYIGTPDVEKFFSERAGLEQK